MQDLKSQALLKLKESYDLLNQAGISESIQDLLFKETWYQDFVNNEDQEYVEFYSCAVCNSNHNMILSVKRDQSFQYSLSIEIENRYNSYSILEKLKTLYRFIKCLFITNHHTNDFLLSHNDLTSFKDLLKKLP
jgi:hypothetical protein